MKKVVLITGASSGIGKSIAQILPKNKYKVFASSRNVDRLDELQQIGCLPLALDVTDESSMEAAMSSITQTLNGVDILINNAGYALNGIFEELPIAELRRQFETNVFGLVRMTQLVLPYMRRVKSGHILNIGSVGGDFTTPGASAYHATKYALEAFSDGLRAELLSFGIDVTLIKPGGVRTEFISNTVVPAPLDGNPYAEFREKFNAMVERLFDPSNKSAGILTPEAVAKVVLQAIEAKKPKTRYRVGTLAKVTPKIRGLVSDRRWDKMMRSQIGVK